MRVQSRIKLLTVVGVLAALLVGAGAGSAHRWLTSPRAFLS